jgi:hypothetical protein
MMASDKNQILQSAEFPQLLSEYKYLQFDSLFSNNIFQSKTLLET